MKFTELALPGVWLIEPNPHSDERGVFRRHFCAHEFEDHGLAPAVAQANVSENPTAGTLRGFHYQLRPHGEAKTMSCLTGAVYDIVADLRPESPTFMQWVAVDLSAAARNSLHVPAGCANAWMTTVDHTVMHYYVSEFYTPAAERGLRYDDPVFGFKWPNPPRLISDKDRSHPDFDPRSLRAA